MNTMTKRRVNIKFPAERSYMYFQAVEATTYTFTKGNDATGDLYYSTDKTNWTQFSSGTATTSFPAGSKVYIKGNIRANANNGSGPGYFSSTGKFNVGGNLMSILNFGKLTKYACARLFSECSIVDASNLKLPAMTLAPNCYESMFYNCTNLIAAPTLPATILVEGCYLGMFMGCSSLTTAPALPATTLAVSCYEAMFSECTSLVTTPELPVTLLSRWCYKDMFYGCSSLVTAHELPATTLADGCYNQMFSGCTSLTTAPELPVTTLARYCYTNMFNGCTSLTTAPLLPAIVLADGCYSDMFYRCTSLVTAPELPATTLAQYCYTRMFQYCSSLNYIKCLATNKSAYGCTTNWVSGVAASGTFVKDANTTWTTGANGAPSGWTVENYTE